MSHRINARLVAVAVLSVVGVTVLAGCDNGSPTASGTATASATSTPTAPATASATGTPTASVTTRAALPEVLGPASYGPITLGMSKEQALATGLLGKPQAYIQCTAYPFKGYPDTVTGGMVAINPQFGVVSISAPADVAVHTPEGIGVGSTEASTKSAYPELGEGFNRGKMTAVPGAPNAHYMFAIGNGKIRAFGLASDSDLTCGAS